MATASPAPSAGPSAGAPPSDAAGGRRARQKAETRARLLVAARQVFTDGSVVTTPLDAVATAAGVSKATLFFHFGERRELLEALTGELYIELYHELGALDASTLRVFLEGYLRLQVDPRVRLLWALGDVLTADGAPLQDTAYAHLGIAIGLHLAGEGLPPDQAGHLTAVVAPATFLMARRAAFGQLEADEVPQFLDHVDALVHPTPAG